ESAVGHRARNFASRISDYDVRIAYRSSRKFRSILSLFRFLIRTRPAVIYVFDISYSGVMAAALYRFIFGKPLIVETGDAISELVESTGSRGKLGLWLTRRLENFALKISDRVVVRGSFHREWLARRGIRADVIQDGVDTRRFASESDGDLRERYGL